MVSFTGLASLWARGGCDVVWFVDFRFVLVCGFRVCSGCFLGISDLCGVGVIYILLIDSWCCFVGFVVSVARLAGFL